MRSALAWLLLLLCFGGMLFAWTTNPIYSQALETGVFVLMLLWLVRWMAGRAPEARVHWIMIPLAVIPVIGGLEIVSGVTVYSYRTAVTLIDWVAAAVIFFLAFQTAADDDYRRMRTAIALFSCALSAWSVLEHYAGNGRVFEIFTPEEGVVGFGPILNPDHFATFVILIAPLAVYSVGRFLPRWSMAAVAAGFYGAVIASNSRGGFVIFTVELLVMFVLLNVPWRVAALTLVFALLFTAVVGWEYLYGKFLGDLYAGRRELTNATLRMIHDHPWRGTGLGTWTLVYPSYAVVDFGLFANAAHCDWLQWIAEGGIAMGLCVAAVFSGAIRMVRRVPWALGVPMVFLHSLVDFPMQGHMMQAWVFLILGIAARASLETRHEQAEEAE